MAGDEPAGKALNYSLLFPSSRIAFRKVEIFGSTVIIKNMIYIHINFLPERTCLQKILW